MPVSLPTRECGLKSRKKTVTMRVSAVTPYAGVWIEIANFSKNSVPANVTPYAGVWIEICSLTTSFR